jgi:hypothetical protein
MQAQPFQKLRRGVVPPGQWFSAIVMSGTDAVAEHHFLRVVNACGAAFGSKSLFLWLAATGRVLRPLRATIQSYYVRTQCR